MHDLPVMTGLRALGAPRSPAWRTLLAATALVALAGCGGTEPPGPAGADGGTSGGTDAAVVVPPSRWVFATSTIEEGDTGHMPQLRVAPDGRLGLVFLRRSLQSAVCMRLMGNPPVANWEILYAESTGGGAFTVEKVADMPAVVLTGVALTFDDASVPHVAFRGGEEGLYYCGGTDVIVASRSGNTWTRRMVDGDGNANTPVFPEDIRACADAQNYCGVGDVVGEWVAASFYRGQLAVAYRDTAFGFAQDDEKKADLELAWDGLKTIDGTYGGGRYATMAIDGDQRLYVAHLNPYDEARGDGIYVVRHDGTTWSRKKISTTIDVGYRLGIAASGRKVGVAYFWSKLDQQKLRFIEAADGETWTEETVDQSGKAGRSPSLAYDPAGRPAIAYQHCGPFDGTADCEQQKDALKFAVKVDGRWTAVDVVKTNNGRDGDFVSLVFDRDGRPVIAYQAAFFDPASGEITRSVRIARGTLE